MSLSVHLFLNNFLPLMHTKTKITINTTTENKPIKTFHTVLLSPLSSLFIIVSLRTLVHSAITLPINLIL